MGDETLLDGVTITEAASYGIYGNVADFVVENCRVVDNQQYGIFAQNGDVSIKWCEVGNNGVHGIYHTGKEYMNITQNCRIHKNIGHGIFAVNTTPILQNTIISENGSVGESTFGVLIVNPSYEPVMYNNTIVYNRKEGVSFTDNGTTIDPNDKNWPDIQNCILWYNNSGGMQVAGFDANTLPQYCCIYNPADPNGTDYTLNARNNFSGNPGFAYGDPNNLHLAWNSPCKDRGNPYHTIDDVGLSDMDGEERIVDNRVDIGADEICSCDEDLSEDDIRHPLDWDSDGVINNIQFGEFSRAWLSCEPNFPGDPNNWNPVCNLDKTGNSEHKIDLGDLAVFCEDNPQVWLWRACWEQSRMNFIQTTLYPMIGGRESMMSMREFVFPAENLSATEQTKKSIEQQILKMEEAIDFLEKIWLGEPNIQEEINPEDWQEFMKAVYKGLFELQTQNVQVE
ncbi:MAG TPA: right-handed parallel beta-helix repeat-containing protein [Anaerohalosphaeraceae bacterium]|nr:right-handed parallel beta-helix repeat-containing protein [Anaerohalosphaeraceae bacterium]